MAKNRVQTKDNKKRFHKNNQQQRRPQHNPASNKNRNVKKSPSKISRDRNGDNKKINYVLNPRLLKKRIDEQRQDVQREKVKAIETKKRKRNAIFMKTTEKGQPKLSARMKILYDQIARSCGKA